MDIETFDRDESMVCELVRGNSPILKQHLEEFDFNNAPIHPTTITQHLAETMLHHNGLGLSCNQIGMPYRACIIKTDPLICMFNPRIVSHSNDTDILEEGCLSFPNLIIKIRRPRVIRVRYTEPNGNIVTNKYEGMTARIIQHEIDHLDGITFDRKANKIHLEQAKRKKQRWERLS